MLSCPVPRFVAVFLVLLLAASLSGAVSLIVPEPCSAVESTSADSNCPPTCVTCGCCHHAVAIMSFLPVLTSVTPPRDATEPLRSLSDRDPRDILHVPRRAA